MEVNKSGANYDFVKSAGLKSVLDENKDGKITDSDFEKMSPSKLKLAEKAVNADTILTKEQKETIICALKFSKLIQLDNEFNKIDYLNID